MEKNEFGMDDKMQVGLRQLKDCEAASVPKMAFRGDVHPMEVSETCYRSNLERGQMEQLRKVQGLHAPLRLQMEKMLVSRAGHLPCLSAPRSNFSRDILDGNDSVISFEDVLGRPENFESRRTAIPHDVIEASLSKGFAAGPSSRRRQDYF